ncbi:MAG: NADH-quinone oxidoreductase subunit J [bacterium]
MEAVAFYIFAACGLASAIAAVSRRDPLMCAAWFAGVALSAGAILLILRAPMVAGAFVIVAAGVSMVFSLFVMMLMDSSKRARARQIRFGKVLAAVAAGYLAIVMMIAVAAPPFAAAPASGDYFESSLTMGKMMVSQYALPFELTGVMLLAAAVASIIIAKRGEGA